MTRRGQVAAVTTSLLIILTAGLGVAEPHLRERTLFTAAAAVLTSDTVKIAHLDPSPTSDRTVYLLIGSDRRQPRHGSVRDIRGERADAVILLSLGRGGAPVVVSLPRDLRVHVTGHGDGKLSGALDYGPAALVDSVKSLTHLPIHHYVEVEFSALTSLVDGVGGISIELPDSVRDLGSGLHLTAGPQVLNGRKALAYLRSRNLEALRGRVWVRDDSGDIGRISREQQVMRLLVARLSACSVLACLDALRTLGGAVTVDSSVDADALSQLASEFTASGGTLSTYVLPTVRERSAGDSVSPFPPTHVGNVGYRRLEEPAADAVLHRLLVSATTSGAGT